MLKRTVSIPLCALGLTGTIALADVEQELKQENNAVDKTSNNATSTIQNDTSKLAYVETPTKEAESENKPANQNGTADSTELDSLATTNNDNVQVNTDTQDQDDTSSDVVETSTAEQSVEETSTTADSSNKSVTNNTVTTSNNLETKDTAEEKTTTPKTTEEKETTPKITNDSVSSEDTTTTTDTKSSQVEQDVNGSDSVESAVIANSTDSTDSISSKAKVATNENSIKNTNSGADVVDSESSTNGDVVDNESNTEDTSSEVTNNDSSTWSKTSKADNSGSNAEVTNTDETNEVQESSTEETNTNTSNPDKEVSTENEKEENTNQDTSNVTDNSGTDSLVDVTEDTSSNTSTYVLPVAHAQISNDYMGYDALGTGHKGIDFAAAEGTPVNSVANGTIIESGYTPVCGNYVIIQHQDAQGNYYTTYYGHMSAIYATQGQTVNAGTMIGAIGQTGLATGAHLHFELSTGTQHWGNQVNPRDYMTIPSLNTYY